MRLNARDVAPGEALLAFGPARLPGLEAAAAVMNLSPAADLDEAAANLFGYLRALDAKSPRAIAVMAIPEEGLGRSDQRPAAPRGGGAIRVEVETRQ